MDFLFRYPYFGSNMAKDDIKFNVDETFVNFDSTISVGKNPFKNAPLWDSLFPINEGVKSK